MFLEKHSRKYLKMFLEEHYKKYLNFVTLMNHLEIIKIQKLIKFFISVSRETLPEINLMFLEEHLG